MFEKIKKILYFPTASYFKFFAQIKLKRWNPMVIVVTGSSGKTTLLHMLESQIGAKARFSHHANSSFGIPFDILDLHRKKYTYLEWFELAFKAILAVFAEIYKENIYVVEADCDRPNEGKFLASLLKPDITLWLNVGKTHSMNFDQLCDTRQTKVEDLIAYEFGYFVEYCKKLLILNGDNEYQIKQTERAGKEVEILEVKIKNLKNYSADFENTIYQTDKDVFKFAALLPKDSYYCAQMTKDLMTYLKLPFDNNFKRFKLPPGRATILKGIKDTTIIDSSYNANLSSMKAILAMFAALNASNKWLVLGDMLELGKSEQAEHEALAEIILQIKPARVILIGKLVSKYTYHLLNNKINVVKFQIAAESLNYFEQQITGGETILFKGSQSIKLEGIIEKLLITEKDLAKLPRRGEFWDRWRKKAGL